MPKGKGFRGHLASFLGQGPKRNSILTPGALLDQAFFNIFEKNSSPKKLNDFSCQNSTNR